MKKVVWLRIYLGREILKKQNGEIQNENQLVKLVYGTLEWKNYLKGMKSNPFCKVEVEKVFQQNEKGYDEIKDFKNIKEELLLSLQKDKAQMTKEQIEIAELKEQMAELLGKKKKVKKDEPNDLENLRKQYLEKFGKKAHHMFKAEKIIKLLKD